MLKAILFDWDDTLAHTRPAVVDAMEYVLSKYGKESWDITKTKYRDTQKSLKENFPNFFGTQANEAYQDYLAYYTNNGYSKVVACEGASDFLQWCNKKKIDIFIISNKEKSLLLKEVAFCFPDISFSKILGNGDAPQNKPAPIPVFVALKKVEYPIDKNNVWLIGDTKQDTECAYNAGIQPVLLGKGKFMNDDYIKSKKDSLLIFNNFYQIRTYLSNNFE